MQVAFGVNDTESKEAQKLRAKAVSVSIILWMLIYTNIVKF